jgi:hypothetical protein
MVFALIIYPAFSIAILAVILTCRSPEARGPLIFSDWKFLLGVSFSWPAWLVLIILYYVWDVLIKGRK